MDSIKEICPTMTKANKFIGDIIKSFSEESNIDNKYIKELIQYHPTKKLNFDNMEWLMMKKRPPYNNLALFYKNKNNLNYDDISWKLCIRNLYGKFDHTKQRIEDVKTAFRNESDLGTKQTYWENNTILSNNIWVGKCDHCNITSDSKSTDHYPITYIEIFDQFIEKYNIELNKIDIFENEGRIRLLDKTLANKWLTFHDSIALYRILCKKCNSRFGCYGYK
jgi:hypothetical protein